MIVILANPVRVDIDGRPAQLSTRPATTELQVGLMTVFSESDAAALIRAGYAVEAPPGSTLP